MLKEIIHAVYQKGFPLKTFSNTSWIYANISIFNIQTFIQLLDEIVDRFYSIAGKLICQENVLKL